LPAGTIVHGNGGLLAVTGVASSTLFITFYKDDTLLHAIFGDAGTVGV
jgi:hypothetical protein